MAQSSFHPLALAGYRRVVGVQARKERLIAAQALSQERVLAAQQTRPKALAHFWVEAVIGWVGAAGLLEDQHFVEPGALDQLFVTEMVARFQPPGS